MKKILTLDGGGVRGLISAIILKEIESRTNKQIAKCFDLIAGSSVGGIQALVLTSPDLVIEGDKNNNPLYSAEDLVKLFKNYSKDIFHLPLGDRLLGITANLNKPKYSNSGLKKTLQIYLGDGFIEDAVTEVFITSYDSNLRIPIFFTSNKDKEKYTASYYKLCKAMYAWEVGMATSAAPTYFEPYKLDEYSLIDGGVYANNPSILGALEYPPGEDKLIVSLGTGAMTRSYSYSAMRKWGVIRWAQPIINILLDTQAECMGYQMESYATNNSKLTHYRIQCNLTDASDDMDNTSNANLDLLEYTAYQLIKTKDKEIDEICKLIT